MGPLNLTKEYYVRRLIATNVNTKQKLTYIDRKDSALTQTRELATNRHVPGDGENGKLKQTIREPKGDATSAVGGGGTYGDFLSRYPREG